MVVIKTLYKTKSELIVGETQIQIAINGSRQTPNTAQNYLICRDKNPTGCTLEPPKGWTFIEGKYGKDFNDKNKIKLKGY